MTTEFKVGDIVTMNRNWLKSVYGILDSHYHHGGKVTEVRKSTLIVQWDFEDPQTILTNNIILYNERHLESR